MMCGMAFPDQIFNQDYEYSAGGLCGKTAPVGGWSNVFAIPFATSITVTVRADPVDGKCQGYINLRGNQAQRTFIPGTSIDVTGYRLQLQSNALALRAPLDFVNVASVPAGSIGIIFMVSWAVEARPTPSPANGGGYIEGCWNFHGTAAEPYPGLVVGTGVEVSERSARGSCASGSNSISTLSILK